MPAVSDQQLKSIEVDTLKGVGPKFAGKLNKLGIFNLFDLVLDLPFRYIDKTHITKVAQVKQEGYVLLDVTVRRSRGYVGSRSKVLKIELEDDSGYLDAVFFNTYPSFAQNFTKQRRLLAFGMAKFNEYTRSYTLQHPEVEFLQFEEKVFPEKHLTPVYHLTEKMPQANMRKIVKEGLSFIEANELEELLDTPSNPYRQSLNEAILRTHYPDPSPDHGPLQVSTLPSFERICFEELVAYQLTLLTLKKELSGLPAARIALNREVQDRLLQLLPFRPTGAQLRTFEEITSDLQSGRPMMRLVHGDVGSGKTLVAIMAMLQMCANGMQSVMMAPTELLAIQHFNNVAGLLGKFGINTVILHSSLKRPQRQETLEMIAFGAAQVIVGTHAVFQQDVSYKNLCLAIIDEHHRFGIDQREALLAKTRQGQAMHQLAMTATPIPKTMQIALYSDLDVSVLDEMPQGRQPIQTALISQDRKNEVIQRVNAICQTGVQVYWVCPMIEEHEELDAGSATATHKELQQALPHLQVGLIHGQLNNNQKKSVMEDFLFGRVNILVATTIIEVGVDVPNASVIVIEDADRLGLAQLHQLRGRVGRGSAQSYCLLLYKEDPENQMAMQRLMVMRQTNDGFEIARQDLKLRGPGEVFGTAQAGFNNFRVADVNRDINLVENARKVALDILKTNEQMCDKLIDRWFDKNSLSKTPEDGSLS